ncbi:MAG: hypothetical protein HQK89_17765 [Nitrospirae bacterium]|nr:hypothetical protein [Nitrospirota bacterium]
MAEISSEDVRYIVRRNSVREQEVRQCRDDQFEALRNAAKQQNDNLSKHPRAKPETAVRTLTKKSVKLNVDGFAAFTVVERAIVVTLNEAAVAEEALLDG